MLVLSRKRGEQLQIGDDVTITVLEVHGHRVRVGIQAPASTRVVRAELRDWEQPPTSNRQGRTSVLLAG